MVVVVVVAMVVVVVVGSGSGGNSGITGVAAQLGGSTFSDAKVILRVVT